MASENNETPTNPVEPAEATGAVEATEPVDTVETTEPTDACEPTEGKEEAGGEDIGEMSDDEPPPAADDVAPEASTVEFDDKIEEITTSVDAVNAEELTASIDAPTTDAETPRFKNSSANAIPVPDFSDHRTNVGERLWRAMKLAEESGTDSSPDIISHEKEFQERRKKMALLNKYVDDYANAMQEVVEKRNQLFKQYALLSEDTPLFDRIGKPLSDDHKFHIDSCGNMVTMEGIEARTHAIMQASDEIGAGSLMAHQELAMMQEEMNLIDFKAHTAAYINEWDDVMSSTVDKEIKEVRLLERKREHYVEKVDDLREKVNKIEHKGKQSASKRQTDKLERNEKKLANFDSKYHGRANGASVLLQEATKRGWVDLYPVIKNVMKFEINRLGRESACYGSFHSTLTALKTDYREATAGTVDHPHSSSSL